MINLYSENLISTQNNVFNFDWVFYLVRAIKQVKVIL